MFHLRVPLAELHQKQLAQEAHVVQQVAVLPGEL
jgi:hypothetical protein